MAEARIHIRLTPRSGKNEITRREGNVWFVRVAAPPVDGAANLALVNLLADVLSISRSSIQIEAGHTSRQKRVSISGLDQDEALARLERTAKQVT